METDTFSYQLFKALPDTLFRLIDKPLEQLAEYYFDAMEIKKSYRLDGLLLPNRPDLPLYFVEVPFQRKRAFYANLFAKVFSYLEANNPDQNWVAIALFADRSIEPTVLGPYQALLDSPQVRRIYLNEVPFGKNAPPGLALLQLATCPEEATHELAAQVKRRARQEPDCERANTILKLLEEILIRRFYDLSREKLRRMFKLHDIRETRVWQEAHEEGIQKGKQEGMKEGMEEGKQLLAKEIVERLMANGMPVKTIAQVLGISVAEVRRLAKKKS